jgi:hypothetical protein
MDRVLVVGALLTALSAASCMQGVCDCSHSGVQIVARGVRVQSITVDGPACKGLPIASDGYTFGHRDTFVPGGDYYYIMPTTAGECTVTIELDTGAVIERTVTFVHPDGCCHGYYTHPSSWKLEQMVPDAGVD